MQLDRLSSFPVTAFDAAGELALGPYREHLRHQIDAGPAAIFACCGTGEFFSLTLDEYAVAVRAAVEEAAGALPVFAGTGYGTAMAKHGWRYVLGSRARGETLPRATNEPGANGSVVGLMSLGATGRATARLLARHDVVLQTYDPYVDPAVAAELGVRFVSLDELFATSDVVSLHAPVLPATRKVVGTELLRSMKPDTTLINTARGALIDEVALVAVLRERPDLFAVLDVTDPEPPLPGSPLFELPNVVVTPHLAGTLNTERRRHGRLMAEELARYVAGEPLQHEVFEAGQARSA